MPLAKGYWL